jgi:HEAT repeat protein
MEPYNLSGSGGEVMNRVPSMILGEPPCGGLTRRTVPRLIAGMIGLLGVGCGQPATPPQAARIERPAASAVADPAEAPAAQAPRQEAVVAAPAQPPAAAKPPTPSAEQPAIPDQPATSAKPDAGAAPVAPADRIPALRAALAGAANDRARVDVIDDIAQLGQNARPMLADLVACTTDPDVRVRWHAARAIGMIGEDALAEIPTLVKLLEDPDAVVATQAAAAIGAIRQDDGRPQIPEADDRLYAAAAEQLVKAAIHPDPRVRRAALRSVRRLTPSVQDLAPLFSRQLADADPSVVMPALHSLADMDEAAVPFLMEALKDPKSRYWACVALTDIGPEAAPAVEQLGQIASEGETTDRMQALLALAAIGEKAGAAAPTMVKALEADDDALHFAAAFALGSTKSAAGDASLERAASGSNAFLADVAAWALARIHPDNKPMVDRAVSRLRAALKAERPNQRAAAASGLSDLAPGMPEADRRQLADDFVGLLADADPEVGISGGAALIRLGASALGALDSKLADPALRPAVLQILAALGPAAKPATDELVALLDAADPLVREEAAVALAAIGPDSAEAVPALLKLLVADEPADSKYAAAYALGRIGTAGAPALERLRGLAGSSDEVLATVAVWAALKIAPEDTSLVDMAIPALRKAARSPREVVRLEAAVALGEIGSAAVSAVPILELLAEEDPVPSVRAAAAAALEKVRSRP